MLDPYTKCYIYVDIQNITLITPKEYFKQLIHENDQFRKGKCNYLEKESVTIDAFACLRIKDKLISCTPIGYDAHLPQNLNLYRQLTKP